MIYLTNDECAEWCSRNQVELPTGKDRAELSRGLRVELALSEMTYALSTRLKEAIGPWHTCLLWITDDDIWRSSSNLHLYYRLRQSYIDHRLISQAPGHLFLKHEEPDLITFVQVGLLSGWDFSILSDMGYGRVFVSHDSWAEVWRSNEKELESIAGQFQQITGRSGETRT